MPRSAPKPKKKTRLLALASVCLCFFKCKVRITARIFAQVWLCPQCLAPMDTQLSVGKAEPQDLHSTILSPAEMILPVRGATRPCAKNFGANVRQVVTDGI